MRSLDFTVLNRINALFLEDTSVQSFVNKSLGDRFIEAYMNYVARFSALYYSVRYVKTTSVNRYDEMVKALQAGTALSRSAFYSHVPEDVCVLLSLLLCSSVCLFS